MSRAAMRTTDFDRIASCAPLDAQASIVRDGSGDHWEAPDRQQRWIAPPPMKPVPVEAPKLTGLTTGRLKVLGYYGSNKNTGAQWVVRCGCGAYELRRSRALLTPACRSREPMCSKCDHLEHVKQIAVAATKGRWPDGKPFEMVGLRTSTGDARLHDEQRSE